MGIGAEFIGEAQDSQVAIDNVIAGRIQLLFISPESSLNNKSYKGMLLSDKYKEKLVAVVVDEAHCVKTWYVIILFPLISMLYVREMIFVLHFRPLVM